MGPYIENQFDVNTPQYGVGSGSSGAGWNIASTLAGLIPGVGGLISSGMNLIGNFMQNRQEKKMWEMNNEYNSPLNQMKRMQEAGINPNLAAAGIAGTNQMASAPQAAQMPDLGALGQGIGNSVNSALQAKSIQAQIDNVKADTDYKKSQTTGQDIENMYAPEKARAIIDDLVAGKELKGEQKRYNQYQADIAKSFADHAEEFRQLEIDKLNKEIENYDHEWKKIESDIKRNQSEIGLNGVQAQLAKAQVDFWNSKLDGFEPGSPQYVLAKAAQEHGVDSDEYKEALQVATDVDKKLRENAAAAQVESTPQGRIKLSLEKRMNDEIAAANNELNEIQRQLHSAIPGSPHYRELKSQCDYIRDRKIPRIEKKYTRRMRRVDKGASGGVTVAGTGVSAGG